MSDIPTIRQQLTIKESAGGGYNEGTQLDFDEAHDYYLGEGAIGTVYKEPRDNPQYVIKVLNRGSDASESFEKEYEIISEIHAKTSEQAAVPPIAKALLQDGRSALVMPYYSNAEQLSDWYTSHSDAAIKNAAWHRDLEFQTINTALAFAEVMVALRKSGHTCVDRKVGDFFYDAAKITPLVIIDWNVVNPMKMNYYAAELALFAALWYDMVTGRVLSGRLHALRDAQWQRRSGSNIRGGVLSLGLRLLMVTASQTPIPERFPNTTGEPHYTPLIEALEQWRRVVKSSTIDDIEEFVALLPESVVPADERETYVELLQLDWQCRQAPTDDALWEERQNLLQNSDVLDEQVTGDAKIIRAVRDDADVSKALDLAQHQYEEAQAAQDWYTASHKHRWIKLLEVMRDTLRTGSIRNTIRENLLYVGTDLTYPPEEDAQRLAAVEERLVSSQAALQQLNNADYDEALSTIEMVSKEVQLRQKAIDYRKQTTLDEQLKRIEGLLAEADDIEYLSQPATTAPATDNEANDLLPTQPLTLLAEILPYHELTAQLENFTPDADTLVYETMQMTYRVLRVLHGINNRDFRIKLKPYADFVDYAVRHSKTDAKRLRSVLEDGIALRKDQALAGQEGIHQAIEIIIREHGQKAQKAIQDALNSKQPSEIVQQASIATTLRAYNMELSKISSTNDAWQATAQRWQQHYDFICEWQQFALRHHRATANQEPSLSIDEAMDVLEPLIGDDPLSIDIGALLDMTDQDDFTPTEWRDFIVQELQKAKRLNDEANDRTLKVEKRLDEKLNALNEEMRKLKVIKQRYEEAKKAYVEAVDNLKAQQHELLTDNLENLIQQELHGRPNDELDALQEKLRELENRISQVPSSEVVDELSEKIGHLQEELNEYRQMLLVNLLNRLKAQPYFTTPSDYEEAVDVLAERLMLCPHALYSEDLKSSVNTLPKLLAENLVSTLRTYSKLSEEEISKKAEEFKGWAKEALQDADPSRSTAQSSTQRSNQRRSSSR